MNKDLIGTLKEIINRDDRLVSFFIDPYGNINISITPYTPDAICNCKGVE